MSTLKIGWYIIYTKPRHEKKLADRLGSLDIEFFLPLTKTIKIWRGRKKLVHLPLFPSYIFVKLESLQHYFDSLHIPGVLYYVRIGSEIAQVNETIIQKLQTLGTKNSYADVEVTSEQFSKGIILSIEAGPFKGFSCEIIRHKGRLQMLVRIELLQRNIIVDLPSWCLGYPERNVLVKQSSIPQSMVSAN